MKIELPFLPLSVNQCYGTDWNTKRRFKTKPYNEFIANCATYMASKKISGDIEVEFNFYFPDKRKRDCSNYIKGLEDTLVHYGVIDDDSFIQILHVEKYYQKGKPETIIEIKSI